MRILYLNTSGKLGGAETSLLNLLKGLRELYPEWCLHLVLGEEGEMTERARDLGVDVQVLSMPAGLARSGERTPGKLLAAATEIWNYRNRLDGAICGIRPDIIHTNGLKMHLLGAWASSGPAGVKAARICHLHDYVTPRPLSRRLMAASIGRFSAVVTNSDSVASDVLKLPVRKERVFSIHNGVDPSQFTPAGATANLDALGGFPPAGQETLRVGLVATFAKWKGHLTFLRAISLLPESLPVRAYIVGGPIYQTGGSQHAVDDLRDEAHRLGIEAKICFTGFVPDAVTALRALDIVVHASTEPEPFGMVIIEAMACGKPVIASRAGGATEIFEENATALGHRPGDAVDLAEKIALLARDAPLRARLGARGMATVESRFQAVQMADRFARLYLCNAASESTGLEPLPECSA